MFYDKFCATTIIHSYHRVELIAAGISFVRMHNVRSASAGEVC
jgi:hypothetical protein